MMEQVSVGDVEDTLIIYLVVKILKRGVFRVDDNQGNELGNDCGGCCGVKNECE